MVPIEHLITQAQQQRSLNVPKGVSRPLINAGHKCGAGLRGRLCVLCVAANMERMFFKVKK